MLIFPSRQFIVEENLHHPAGGALTSDWSANSFTMVVFENIYSCAEDRKF